MPETKKTGWSSLPPGSAIVGTVAAVPLLVVVQTQGSFELVVVVVVPPDVQERRTALGLQPASGTAHRPASVRNTRRQWGGLPVDAARNARLAIGVTPARVQSSLHGCACGQATRCRRDPRT